MYGDDVHKMYTNIYSLLLAECTQYVRVQDSRWLVGGQQTTNGERRTANGERRTTNGERRTANGERATANGERRTANGERRTSLEVGVSAAALLLSRLVATTSTESCSALCVCDSRKTCAAYNMMKDPVPVHSRGCVVPHQGLCVCLERERSLSVDGCCLSVAACRLVCWLGVLLYSSDAIRGVVTDFFGDWWVVGLPPPPPVLPPTLV